MSPVVGMNMAPPPSSSTSAAAAAAAGHHQPEDEWPALGNNNNAASAATGAAGVNTSTDSDWEMLNSINVVAGTGAVGGGTGARTALGPSNVIVAGVQPVMSRARRSQTIATEQEAYNKTKTTIDCVAAGDSNNVHGNNLHKLSSFGDHNRNQRRSSNSRPVLKHCQSSPDLRYSYYEVRSIDMMDEEDNSSGSSSGSSSTGSGSRSGSSTSSGVMIEGGDPTAVATDGAAGQTATGSSNDDDEASSSVVLVSGPPSVVTAATTTSAWSMASPAASKLSFKDAVGTSAADAQQQPHHRHHHHHHHKHRQNKPKKKSKIVVVTPVSPASTIRRCSRSTGDLMSLGRMLTEQEAEEEEYQQMRYKNGGGRQQRFPSHFYPKTVVEDHDFDHHHGGGFGFGGGGGDAILGDTDAEEFYNRKEHGKNTRQNGLKSRPDEAKRLDMILAKKDMQRKQQEAKQGKQKAAPKKAETQKKSSSGKGRTRW
mmetsp:Transcript_52826/g.128076  ORF Transcript_52826/g.128076 Transcript_52826/m.128076 type:complete len:482 (+) Transcript_52826:358-1803(+)